MTDSSISEVIGLIKELHDARRLRSEGDRKDKKLSPILKAALRNSGEREAWDQEIDPPIGVALESGHGRRWADVTMLSDDAIVKLARRGILVFSAQVYDAIKDVPDQELAGPLMELGPAIKEGGADDRLVLLPRRGE